MELIFFALMLIAAAILYPEGTRALLTFVLKTTLAIAVAAVVVAVLVGVLSKANPSQPQPEKVEFKLEHVPPRIITLDDGTEIPVAGGWVNQKNEMVFTDEEDAERVRLFKSHE